MDDDFGSFIEESTGYERQADSTEKGSSNSITYLMVFMGFPMSIFLIYCLLRQKLFIIKKRNFHDSSDNINFIRTSVVTTIFSNINFIWNDVFFNKFIK